MVIRGGLIVEPSGCRHADIRVEDGRIAEIATDLSTGREAIDAHGLIVLPGVVDGHVHFNEPGRADWEGAATGSRALAAGGGTMFIDMPLNSTPCTVTAVDVDRKRAALEAASIADFALWGGLVPGGLDHLPEMAARGVVGFKAFMCDSGLPEFPCADETTLREGMRRARALGLPIAVHAELDEFVTPMSHPDAAAFLASRPVRAETAAIERALRLAGDTGAALHLVHVSSGQGVILAAEARARGVDVSIETCPHYLTFTSEDLERLDVVAKCAPPLRQPADRAALWNAVRSGAIDLVGSDHSPAPPAMRIARDFGRSWGGIAGVQSTLATLLTGEGGTLDGAVVAERRLSLDRVAAVLATMPARRFGLAGKGAIVPGFDADLTLVDVDATFTLSPADLQQRHRVSPYVGRTFRGVVVRTIRRGETIYRGGAVVASTRGRFVPASPVGPSPP